MIRATLHQLRILRVVAEEGSIARAAQRLHLTAPTLSIQLKQLTEQLGLPLYQVIGRRLQLTGAGRDALEASRRIDDELKRLEQRLAARGGIERGRLRIAAVSTGEYLVPRLLGRFREAHPGIEASLRILPRDRLLERLDQGLDDVYLMTRPPSDRDVTAERIGANPLVMIAAPDHPWMSRRRIDVRDVARARFVVREEGSGTRLWMTEWLERFGVDLAPALELGSNEAIKQAVQGGHGLAVISLHAVGLELEAGRLALPPVPHFPAPVNWHWVQRRDILTPPAAEAFRRHLADQLPALDAMLAAVLERELGARAVERAGLERTRPAR
ncbi:LysR family transcriptional regulator [Wenzhouxiangella sp. XN79A]|uniref:LysR family transcriptional regulator n=1 Tax=Wenzhouxiangella sp. XN79A TaxID=2724193 RepID=UPI00144AA5B8|nr:LysR family transcriptional regulator [Wenzhouxiangella sp. XN79A]NKI36405.1 LysR family transcriptional regulator [Wenzhouxiangella sp. XN79A]